MLGLPDSSTGERRVVVPLATLKTRTAGMFWPTTMISLPLPTRRAYTGVKFPGRGCRWAPALRKEGGWRIDGSDCTGTDCLGIGVCVNFAVTIWRLGGSRTKTFWLMNPSVGRQIRRSGKSQEERRLFQRSRAPCSARRALHKSRRRTPFPLLQTCRSRRQSCRRQKMRRT